MVRVVVTGLGPVSNVGVGVSAFEAAVRSGRSGIRPIEAFDTTGFPCTKAGEVFDFKPSAVLRKLDATVWGRSSVFAAAAARLAAEDAQLTEMLPDPSRVSVVMGTTCGESRVVEELAEAPHDEIDDRVRRLVQRSRASRLADAASIELGARGESLTIGTACAASNYTIGYAFDAITAGDADVVVAGGADSVCRWVHAGFYRLGSLEADRCAPFDRERRGIITAEGGSAVVLESADHAESRGAMPYAEVLGHASNCDAHRMVAPDANSLAACIRLAHDRAGIVPADVDYICAHGTGTVANDSAEGEAIRAVFGARSPAISSIKSILGHSMGAACGFGAIATCLALRHGFIPPSMNVTSVAPDLDWMDVVLDRCRDQRIRVAQNHGFAFGGNNSIVVFAGADR